MEVARGPPIDQNSCMHARPFARLRPRFLACVMSLYASSTPPPVVVRKLVQQGQPHLEIQVSIDHAAATKTLLRAESEPLAKSLARLTATLNKKAKSKKPSPVFEAAAPVEICFLTSDEAEIDAETTSILDAMQQATTMCIGPMRHLVLFEPPEVTSMDMPAQPLVGIPLRPAIGLRHCDATECTWLWERQTGDQASWTCVGREAQYVPSAADVGSSLRVQAKPPAALPEVAAYLGGSVQTASGVQIPPPRKLLRSRVRAMDSIRSLVRSGVDLSAASFAESVDLSSAEVTDGGATKGSASSSEAATSSGGFRILSYNLMADAYERHWNGPGSVHSYCASDLTKASLRMPRLLEEVLAYDADIVCLQECDKQWFHQMWEPCLEGAGYTGHFAVKRSQGSSEGVATFVRQEKFEILDVKSVPLDLTEGVPPELEPLLVAQSHTAVGVQALPTVALLLLLGEAKGPRRVVVANTHLYFANPAVHVRLIQTAALMHHACTWTSSLLDLPRGPNDENGEAELEPAALPSSPPAALILAGDLNSDSTDAVLRYLTNGVVPADDPDWLHGALLWSPSVGLEADAQRTAREAAERFGTQSLQDYQPQQVRPVPSDSEIVSLADLQPLILRFHRLRKALATLQLRSDEEATEAGLKGAIVADATRGRTLVDSQALACAEVAAELDIPLVAACTRDGLTSGRTRLKEIAQTLEAARTLLQTRASVDEMAPGELAKLGSAAIRLPMPALESAYGLHTNPTHVVPRYANALDWICFETGRLCVEAVAPLPRLEVLTQDVAMPSKEFPSDHVSLAADLRWR